MVTPRMATDTASVHERPPSYEQSSSPLPTTPPPAGYSTQAHKLYTTVGASLSLSDFYTLTFSVMIKAATFEMPLIITVDETFEGLMNDIRLLVNSSPLANRTTGVSLKFLRVDWDSHSSRFASLGGNMQWGRQRGEMLAMLRLLKQRGGIDRLIAS